MRIKFSTPDSSNDFINNTYQTIFNFQFLDMVIAEGPSAIFKISIALLKIHKEKLMKLEGFEHVADYIKNQMNDISDEQIVKILHTAADIDLGNVQKSILN